MNYFWMMKVMNQYMIARYHYNNSFDKGGVEKHLIKAYQPDHI
jgi:hypothetical protein